MVLCGCSHDVLIASRIALHLNFDHAWDKGLTRK
jgi:hypothetical protein